MRTLIADDRQALRAEAEARFAEAPPVAAQLQPSTVLLHEFQVHQIELEMQNEGLRRDQLELELAHERYVDLYDLAPVGILTLSGAGEIREANLNGAGLLGVERARLLGRNFASFVGPDHSDRWQLHLRSLSLARPEEQRACDLVLQRGDGSSFQAQITCRRHEDPEDGLALRVAITEVIAQEPGDARSQAAELRAMHDAMPANICVLDETGVILTTNASWRSFALANQGSLDLVAEGASYIDACERSSNDEQKEGRLFAKRLRALLSGEIQTFDREYPCHSPATERWFHVRVARYLDKGRPRAVVVHTNLTTQVQRERLLQESEERFRALIEHSNDLTLILDGTGTVTFASAACIDMLGRAPSEMKGRTGLDLLHPDDLDDVRSFFAAVIADPTTTRRLVLRMRRADGTWALLEAEARCMLDVPGIRGIVIHHRDITERNLLREQLRESQKLETMGRLASGVAHDINNLLTVILSCGEDLRRTIREGSSSDPGCAEDIVAAGQRAAELTRQLLVFARKEVAIPVYLDLNDLVQTSAKLLRRVVGSRIEIAEEFEASLWTVRCDPGLVGQLIMNLALNARDAMPDGGTLTLGTGNVTVAEGDDVPDPGMASGPYVKLVVRDTGTGMTTDVMKHIFEPLFTTKALGEGTGLGLSMVCDIVKQSRAHLGVRSVVGSGTSFEIFFPKDEECDGVPAGVTAKPEGGTETVLVVEDDPKVREVAVRALGSRGYRVLAAADCDEAVQIARAETGPLHLIVAELEMPGPGGREVAARVAELNPGVRALFISGCTEAPGSLKEVRWEEIDILLKPFASSSLARAARNVLDRGKDEAP